MTIDIDTGLKIVSLGLSVGAIIYAFFANRKKDTDERFKLGSNRMDDQERRIAALEQTVQALPGKDELHNLEMMLSDMGGDMKAMRATMRGMSESLSRTENIVTRHEDHLRENH